MADLVRVFTYKEGLLSRVAHDLRLHVEPRGVSVTRTGDSVFAEIDPSALLVDGAVRDSRVDALGDRDHQKILETVGREILLIDRHPKIRFSGAVNDRGQALEVRGELELLGVARPLSFSATREDRRIRARVSLRPSDWGIRPYKALAGAIRLQDRVLVELDLDDRE
ncbi:MAG TPA: YceI family protein [Enhygromyxa sp.]|nr:YceI family protein [Enhygromyxa sp.]